MRLKNKEKKEKKQINIELFEKMTDIF